MADEKARCSSCNERLDLKALTTAAFATAGGPPAPGVNTEPRTRPPQVSTKRLFLIGIATTCAFLLAASAMAVWRIVPELQYRHAFRAGERAEAAHQWDEAREAYQRAGDIRKGDPVVATAIQRVERERTLEICRQIIERGRKAEQAASWQEALAEYEKVLNLRPTADVKEAVNRVNYNLQLELARNAEISKHWAAARLACHHALQIRPNDPDATELLKKVDYSEAIERGLEAEKNKNWIEAAQAYRKALTVRPHDPVATEALRRFSELLAQAQLQENYDAAMKRAAQAEQTQQWQAAVRAYRDALVFKPADEKAAAAIERLGYNIALEKAAAAEQKKDWPAALAAYDEALHVKPNDTVALAGRRRAEDAQTEEQFAAAVQRAAAAEKHKQWAAAIAAYEEALRLKPIDAAALAGKRRATEELTQQNYTAAVERGKQAEQQKDWPSALAAYTEALKHKPGDADAQAALARIREPLAQAAYDAAMKNARQAEQNRQWAAAVNYYQAAIAARPGDPAATDALKKLRYTEAMDRGRNAEARGDWAAAEKAYKDALQAKPGDTAAEEARRHAAIAKIDAAFNDAMRRGAQAEKNRNWTEAAAAYKEALEVKPSNPAASNARRYALAMEAGQQAEQARNWRAALAAYREALNCRPNDQQAQDGIRRAEIRMMRRAPVP